MDNCGSQSYDGAGNMAGRYAGVLTLIQHQFPKFILLLDKFLLVETSRTNCWIHPWTWYYVNSRRHVDSHFHLKKVLKVVHKASRWDCDDFYMGKTKRRLHDRKTEHFKALSRNCQTSAIADHISSTGHNIKWDHFEILANGRSDIHCRIKESLLIKDLKPSLNENVGSEKLFLY